MAAIRAQSCPSSPNREPTSGMGVDSSTIETLRLTHAHFSRPLPRPFTRISSAAHWAAQSSKTSFLDFSPTKAGGYSRAFRKIPLSLVRPSAEGTGAHLSAAFQAMWRRFLSLETLSLHALFPAIRNALQVPHTRLFLTASPPLPMPASFRRRTSTGRREPHEPICPASEYT